MHHAMLMQNKYSLKDLFGDIPGNIFFEDTIIEDVFTKITQRLVFHGNVGTICDFIPRMEVDEES